MVGSVYINVGKIKEIDLLDEVLQQVLKENKRVIVAMDANARNSLWDNSEIKKNSTSRKMGSKLEEVIFKHNLYVHNTGEITYRSGETESAIDVTLSKGICDEFSSSWQVLDDVLSSPHSGILLSVGEESNSKREVKNWKDFDWDRYEDESEEVLKNLLESWKDADTDAEEAASEFREKLTALADSIVEFKTISKHSKPWVDRNISEKLNEVRQARKKFTKHKSMFNKELWEERKKEYISLVENSREEWRIAQCNKIMGETSEKEKWKIINQMTNTKGKMNVQPIRTTNEQGESEYLFDNEKIIKEMENYHIKKETNWSSQTLNAALKELKSNDNNDNENDIMNRKIVRREIMDTFGTCTGAPGPDNFGGSLIDGAERENMISCLDYIWNKAWKEGKFLTDWKEEQRAVLAKYGKDDYHIVESYRTVSLTAVLGKRFEKISAQRILGILEERGFDIDQYAYLEGRSVTQALISIIETLKIAKKNNQSVGAVFFDFSDAFGNVDRVKLVTKLKNDFGISGRLLNHIIDFLCNREARIKILDSQGEWVDSLLGTSAGTVLGPVLFIVFGHDIPKEIKPKFADDVSAIESGKDNKEVEEKLQTRVNQMVEWCTENGMFLNPDKIKLVNFNKKKENTDIVVKIEGKRIEQCDSIKSLGVILDSELDMGQQIDKVTGAARSALNKIAVLMKGRKGISVELGIKLYKTLIRPHLEHALAAWVGLLNENQIKELEKVQAQSLRTVMGVFANSSTNALEVIANVTPFRLRMKELSIREFPH